MEQLVYRSVTDYNELRELSELQGTAWPIEMFTSPVHMKAAVLQGGCVIGAYDGDRPAGFCYGFAGYDGRTPHFHSHMMVVHPVYRDRGAGTRLKLEQRLWAIDRGYTAMTWTFDPFQLRNGYLNVCKLGGTVRHYERAVYGTDELGDPSDRFLIRWELTSPRVLAAIRGEAPADPRWQHYAELIGDVEQMDGSGEVAALPGDGFLLAVPRDAAEVKKQRPELIVSWKRRLRMLCEEAFGRGYRVVGLLPGNGDVSYYVLEGASPR